MLHLWTVMSSKTTQTESASLLNLICFLPVPRPPAAAHSSASSTRSTWRRRCRTAAASSSSSGSGSGSGGSGGSSSGGASTASEGRAPRWVIGSAVPRRQWDDPEVEGFLKRNEPVVDDDGFQMVPNRRGRGKR